MRNQNYYLSLPIILQLIILDKESMFVKCYDFETYFFLSYLNVGIYFTIKFIQSFISEIWFSFSTTMLIESILNVMAFLSVKQLFAVFGIPLLILFLMMSHLWKLCIFLFSLHENMMTLKNHVQVISLTRVQYDYTYWVE